MGVQRPRPDLELPARIFFDSTIDHPERRRRLEETLAKSSSEEERVNLEQYIGGTHRALEMGIERWRVPHSPEGARDELMRMTDGLRARDFQWPPLATGPVALRARIRLCRLPT